MRPWGLISAWVLHGACAEPGGLGRGSDTLCHSGDVSLAAAQGAAAAKDIIFDNDSRRRMQIGINKLADAVGVTLGPRGGHTCRAAEC